VADKSENYKIWYNVWLSKEAKQVIDDAVKAGIPPPSLEDAKKIVQSDPKHEENWMASNIYQKYVRRNDSKIEKNFTTADRFTTSVLKKRSEQIMKEDPELSEEEAMKQADKDLQTRQKNEAGDVAGSADPVSAKILTNISSILMDISEDVLAIRESGPNGLDAAESAREKGGKKEEKEKDEKSKAETFVERLAKMVSVFLIPAFLGFMSKFVDLTSATGLLKAAFVGLIAYFGSKALLTLIATQLIKLFSGIGKVFLSNVLGTKAPTPTVPGTTPLPGPATGGPAGKTTKSISVLTTLGKGIKDLGAGIGAAIYSFFAGFAKGLAAFGNPKTALGIALMVGATAALGGLALLFKKGDIKWFRFPCSRHYGARKSSRNHSYECTC